MASPAIRAIVPLIAILSAWLLPRQSEAHPHLLPTVYAKLSFDPDRKLRSIEYTWLYDAAYSAFVGRDIDSDKDGKVSNAELHAFAKRQIEALSEHHYFTKIETAQGNLEVGSVQSYSAMALQDGRIQLSFALSMSTKAYDGKDLTIELFDPEIFAYFTVAKDGVSLMDAPAGCHSSVTGPQPIDLRNTRSIPAVFWDALNNGSKAAALQLVNRITVACR